VISLQILQRSGCKPKNVHKNDCYGQEQIGKMLYQLSRKLKLERKERRSGRRIEISLKYIRPNAHSASGTPSSFGLQTVHRNNDSEYERY
jgi:recombination DNA repair RAD52 pathway protein